MHILIIIILTREIHEKFINRYQINKFISLKENLIVNGYIEIKFNKDAKNIIGDTIFKSNIARNNLHLKANLINLIKILKSILNSKEKESALIF